jgi:hypothetical protein
MQLEKFERLSAKPKKIKIGGEEFELKPLTMKKLDLFLKMGEEKNKSENMKKLVIETFKNSYEDFDEKYIDNMSLEYFEELIEGILKLHGLEIPEEYKKTPLE